MVMENSKHQATRAQVAGVVLFYMVAALVMVMANKWVLNDTSLPLTFLFIQLVLAVLLIRAAALAKLVVLPPFDVKLCRTISGVIVVNVVGLVYNTLCLKLVDASYFQVARGLVLPLTITLSSLLLKSVPPRPTIFCVLLVTAGFFYGVTPSAASPTNDAGRTKLGIVYGVLSALMIAVHAILVKWSLRDVDVKDMDASFVTNLAYLTNLLSAAALFPVLLINGEFFQWSTLWANEDGKLLQFASGSAITGLFGFFLCMAGLLSITITSPVTHMFSSAVRGVLQTFLGIALFGDVLTVPRTISITMIITGSALYAYYKSVKAPPASPSPNDGKAAEEGRSRLSGEAVPMLEKRRGLRGNGQEDEDVDEEEMDRLEREHEEDLKRREAERAAEVAAK